MWVFPSFGIRPGRKVMWSKVLQVLQTRGSTILDADIPEMRMEPLLQIQENMLEESLNSYKKMFGEKPKKTRTPQVAEDH